MKRKAQTSPEFMVAIAAILFIGMVAQVMIFGKTAEAWHVRSFMSAQDICNSVANELNLAGYSEGRSAFFTIPKDVAGTNYTLTVWSDYVTVDYAGHACVKRFTALDVKYNGRSPPFNLSGGTYRINTTEGVVTLEKFA